MMSENCWVGTAKANGFLRDRKTRDLVTIELTTTAADLNQRQTLIGLLQHRFQKGKSFRFLYPFELCTNAPCPVR